jgi:hypothetical protein
LEDETLERVAGHVTQRIFRGVDPSATHAPSSAIFPADQAQGETRRGDNRQARVTEPRLVASHPPVSYETRRGAHDQAERIRLLPSISSDNNESQAHVAYPLASTEDKRWAAEKAAPYCHPKLTATQLSGTVTISQEDALAALE